MTDTAILEARLAQAEQALHDLSIGKTTASVSYDGKSVSYTQTNIGQLRGYIADLKRQLGRPARRIHSVRFIG